MIVIPLITTIATVGLYLQYANYRLPDQDSIDINKVKFYPSLYNADIDVLAKHLERNDFTSVDLVKAYIARIGEVNDELHVVNDINPDAISIASMLDEERSKGHTRGPLHGIPILIKDTIATADKMNNTAGSWALVGAKVSSDATVVRKLREAGGIILGKTNPSEWGNYRLSLQGGSGWSAYGGQTYGPFYPHQDPSGSSSGSAVAAALGLSAVTLGGETCGSITDVANYNNIVGIKPTVGLVSRHLVVPISQRMDTIGPMTRTVRDSAYVLQSIVGFDPLDNYTSAIPKDMDLDFIGACRLSALQGARIGVPWNVLSLKSNENTISTIRAFEKALKVLKEAGAIIIDTPFPAAEEFMKDEIRIELYIQLMGADFIVNLEEYLSQLQYNPNNITNLAELRKWTRESPLEGYPNKPTTLWDDVLARDLNNTDPAFWSMYQKGFYFGNEGGLLGAIRNHNLDAVVLPGDFSFEWAAIVGSPIATVPMGAMPSNQHVVLDADGKAQYGPNIPFGFSFLGAKFNDAKLLGLAYAYEQQSLMRDQVEPYIYPHTELPDVVRSSQQL